LARFGIKKILKLRLLPHTIPYLSPSPPLARCQRPNAIGCNIIVNFSRDWQSTFFEVPPPSSRTTYVHDTTDRILGFSRPTSGKVDTACFSLLVLKSTLSPKKVKKAVLLTALFKQQCLKSVDLKKLK
jgi:hypothetical protein